VIPREATRFLPEDHTLVVVEPHAPAREVLIRRFRAQGYRVIGLATTVEAATEALLHPPSAVIAPMWMSGFSGVQLCQLLKAEAATAHIPVVLTSPGEEHLGRLWAELSGASWASEGSMGALLRTVARSISAAPVGGGFFTILGDIDIRDRIAAELDRRLFESLLAAEVRSLAACESFERLFDQLSQLLSRVLPYAWLALSTDARDRLGVHACPEHRDAALAEARKATSAPDCEVLEVLDSDPRAPRSGDVILVAEISSGRTFLGTLAVSLAPSRHDGRAFFDLVARELALPMRVAMLVEEAYTLARTDPLTAVLNRRAFVERLAAMGNEGRGYALCYLDLDHFKAVNDRHGHAGGDLALKAVGRILRERSEAAGGLACRWGGEEFLFVLPGAGLEAGLREAERIREEIAAVVLHAPTGEDFAVRISAGLAVGLFSEPFEAVLTRADAMLYRAKDEGRDRVLAA